MMVGYVVQWLTHFSIFPNLTTPHSRVKKKMVSGAAGKPDAQTASPTAPFGVSLGPPGTRLTLPPTRSISALAASCRIIRGTIAFGQMFWG
jgi:hypothetical protein